MEAQTVLGLVAGTLTTFAFVPQVAKIWRTRKAEDISLPMYVMTCVGIVLWLIYGALQGSAPLIAANVAALLLALVILGMKLRFG